MGSADLLALVRKSIAATARNEDVQRPFRFLLCGDPFLVAEFRSLLLRPVDHEDHVPLDAGATLETIDPLRRPTVVGPDVRCTIFLARPGDLPGARIDLLEQLRVPIFVITVDPASPPAAPLSAPTPGNAADYSVPQLDRENLRLRVFPHIVERCGGIEVAVGRRLPALRASVAGKLTRDAASSALKVSAVSAVVDHVPILGIVLGAVASAGDMVAITGIQIVLMMQIGATYGKDPDMQRMWELLPVVGGGLGWRALSRELSGFIPVAGVAIKSSIAYAGTIVVGEGATFYYEHGRHMTAAQASALYEEKRRAAMTFARAFIARLRKKNH